MLINLKVKTLDAQTHEFSIDNEITVREFKDQIAEKTNIAADQQRIIYCGRVLVDEKQLKEYDVDGKVLHVAERPPPSQRSATSSSSSATLHPRGRPSARGGMRSSPLFRALDGMVVGTMAIPMNASMNNGPVPVNPFTSSSSFCMNRITVARHMLECADNIAAYLEEPERGLNNTSLDILARGRWTMESTVVEMGITAADMPQNQNIVEMVQGAVSAALRRNGNTNVTVVQLPNVFGEGEPPAYGAQSTTDAGDGAAADIDGPHAAVIIEDVTDAEEDASSIAAQVDSIASNSGSSTSTVGGTASAAAAAAAEGANNATSTGTNTDDNPARRRTGTRVLAEVIEQLRNVQTRLNPFIQQFYDMLQNEPTFEADDATARENAQRLYDRVSEALHYMSHAQHAISDLMLDVSQAAPRYLTCRPIMVEQSGYVSSNNYLAAAAAAARQQQQQSQSVPRSVPVTGSSANAAAATSARTSSASVSIPTTGAAGNTAATASTVADIAAASPTIADAAATAAQDAPSADSPNGIGDIEDPVDEPVALPFALPVHVGTQSNGDNSVEIVLQPRRGLYFGNNHQMQMARLIQAVVNSAPIDTEFHVQINAPSIVSFGVPVNVNAAAQRQAQTRQQQSPQQQTENTDTAAAAGSDQSVDANENSTNETSPTTSASSTPAEAASSQMRVNTATLPTTSTQTRSTSRPQLQIGNIPAAGWNGRFIPANMMSAFDRFLPCNSHHIREPENANGNGNGNGNAANTESTTPNGTQNQANTVGSTMTTPHASTRRMRMLRHMLGPRGQPFISTDTYRFNLRTQLLDFLNEKIFEGGPINSDTIPQAVNRAVSWFDASLLYLPQYEQPQYNSRDSLANILRRSMPSFISLVNNRQETPGMFERRLKIEFDVFFRRLFAVLEICVGRDNAEHYWGQLMRQLMEPIRSNFRAEAFEFLCIYINPDIPGHTDQLDALQFIVRRDTAATAPAPVEVTATPPVELTETFVSPPSAFVLQPMDTDVEMMDAAGPCFSDVIDSVELIAEDEDVETAPAETLPSVVAGSEPWHRNFPNDWLPIITRDIETQAETQSTQAPFSDAYISGMSAKRRKLVQSAKPPTDVQSLVADSVRKAIQTVGVGNSTASNQSQTADEITAAIANDSAVHASYTETLRSSVRDRLKEEPDYKADRFPQLTKFVNK